LVSGANLKILREDERKETIVAYFLERGDCAMHDQMLQGKRGNDQEVEIKRAVAETG